VVEQTSSHALQPDKREIAFTPLMTPESIILKKTKSPQVKDNRLQVIDKRWWNKHALQPDKRENCLHAVTGNGKL
jgi:hypothetical protein